MHQASTPFSFARKISLHSISLILVSCFSITAVTAYQFRHELYAQEFRSVFTVYMAAVNYLTGHYRSHRASFYENSLRYVFENRFMTLEGAQEDIHRFRPTDLAIYNPEGVKVFEYNRAGETNAPAERPVEDLPASYAAHYDAGARTISGMGPIVSEGETIGFLEITFNTEIERMVRALYVNCALAMAAVIVIAIIFSSFFARRALAPIKALTEAARRVRAGDLHQRVPVESNDEIGMLAQTFNDMTSSLTRRIALMHKTQEWTFRIGKEFDLRKLYETVIEMFERMGQALSCRLYILDAKSEVMQLVGYRGGDTTISIRGDAATRTAFETNELVYLREDRSITGHADLARELAIPLFTGNKRIGAARLGPRESHDIYNEETVTTLRTLAQLAAVAIENTRLYKEVAERERIAQEMKWAREIQQSLLPRAVPHVPGYEIYGMSIPALEVGGDYFDYVASGQHWHFVVGDVSGKGVPAALIMSIVRSLIHTCAEMTDTPRDMLAKVNRNLSPDLEAEMFVTIADVSVDAASNVLRVVRAGHEPILVIRKNGSVERIEPRGSGLGLLDVETFESTLQEQEIRLEVGDSALLFTDGLTETRSLEGVEVGYDGVEALAQKYAQLSPNDMVNAIAEEIKAFAGGQDQHDDFTLVVFRRIAV